MKGIYLLLGSNLGDSNEMLSAAQKLVEHRIGAVVKTSSVYQTKAWGIENQPDFLNKVLEVDSDSSVSAILEEILKIERDMGRIRYQKWGSRIIDIDILYFGAEVIDTKDLVVPHPENQNRNFVLAPMAEIAPNLLHPYLNLTQEELLHRCSDKLEVIRLK